MATCSLGTSNIRILNLELGRKRVGVLQLCSIRSWTGRRSRQCPGLVTSRQSEKLFTVCCSPSIESQSVTRLEDGSEEIKPSGSTVKLIPNFNEVESLIIEVCDTSSIAEFELKFGGFHLHLTRDLAEKTIPPPASIPDSGSVNTIAKAPNSNGSNSTSSLAIAKPMSFSGGIQRLLNKAADEGLVIINSPRVGFFRRSRTIKGKRAPPSCKEKQVVKEGQVVCYIEQLGGELPIESDVSGEIIKILQEDGDPVGYGDALIAVLPSFPGIKKLQVVNHAWQRVLCLIQIPRDINLSGEPPWPALFGEPLHRFCLLEISSDFNHLIVERASASMGSMHFLRRGSSWDKRSHISSEARMTEFTALTKVT